MTKLNRKFLTSCAAAPLLLLYAVQAQAQSAPGAIAGLPAGVTAVSGPLVSPPEPDAASAPKAHADWARATKTGATVEVGHLTPTSISNGPHVSTGQPSSVSNGYAYTTSGNWSGSAVSGEVFTGGLEAIESTFVVPTAHQAFGACTGGWDWSSVWPGIDGWGSSDVLQGGIEADAFCIGGSRSAFYSAWIEWYPFNETRVSSPAISPGDELFVEVWNVTSTSGYVYFHDYSTNVTAEYHLTAPSGTTLKGNSVEWIVERPGVNGSLATLTNYIDVTLTGGVAWNYGHSPATNYYPFVNPSVGTLELITMLDNNGKGISSATGWNSNTLWFQDFGSACGIAGNTAGPC